MQLEKRIQQNVQVARELIAVQKKDRALLALKKKKLNEHQLGTIQAWLLNVEDMLSNMELTKQQQKIFTALKEGNAALKKAQAEVSMFTNYPVCLLIAMMSVDDVQVLMEETAESKEYQDRVQHILSEQLDDTDNDAVLEEFHALELNVLGSEAAALPSVPTTRVQEEVGQALETSVLTSSSTQQQKQQQQLDVEEELPSPPSTKVQEEPQVVQQQQDKHRGEALLAS
eukprot:jgi/Chrzof1/13570/Cz08g02150.t1